VCDDESSRKIELNCRSTGVWKGAILKVSLTLLDGIVSRAALETLENVAADQIKF